MAIHITVAVGMAVLYLAAWNMAKIPWKEKSKDPFICVRLGYIRPYFEKNPKLSLKMLTQVLLLLAVCNLLGGILSFQELQKEKAAVKKIRKDRETASVTELEIWTEGGKRKPISLEVPPQNYTDTEVEKLLQETKESLNTAILGENSSLAEVRSPLQLTAKLGESPVQLTWTTSNPLVLDWNGVIGEEVEEQGSRVTLLAELFLEGKTESVTFEAVIFPPRQTKEELWNSRVQGEVRSWNEGKFGADYELPDTLVGEAVSWHFARENTGVFLLLFGILAAFGIVFGTLREGTIEEQKKEEQMLSDYPAIVSKLLLLLGAGLSMRKSMERIAVDYQKKQRRGSPEKHMAYEELVQTMRDMECGISEKEAYERFGNRCKCAPYRALSILLVRNLQKGSRGLAALLEKEAAESFENRKRQAKILGDKISTKLLLPMGIMLILVLAILIVPAFLSF